MRAIGQGVRWFVRSGLRWAILALLIVAFLWFVPQLQGEYFSQNVPAAERPALVNEYRRTWAQIIGGFGLLLGLYFTWRRVDISQRALEATQDQQVTERFTRAIDQLGATDDKTGAPQSEVRLGGIYALERIARDSEKDHWPIMEVLTAYVRQHAPEPQRNPWGVSEEAQEGEEDAATAKKPREDSRDESETVEIPALAPDIQAIMTVLRRRTRALGHGEPEALDLHETKLWTGNLSGASLQAADLVGANLWYANLEGANLWEANLGGADLSLAYLGEAGEANFQGAKLSEANLRRANLAGATCLIQAQLEETTGDEDTRLPPDLKPPAHWGVKIDDQPEED